jgi:hypothetical protein
LPPDHFPSLPYSVLSSTFLPTIPLSPFVPNPFPLLFYGVQGITLGRWQKMQMLTGEFWCILETNNSLIRLVASLLTQVIQLNMKAISPSTLLSFRLAYCGDPAARPRADRTRTLSTWSIVQMLHTFSQHEHYVNLLHCDNIYKTDAYA